MNRCLDEAFIINFCGSIEALCLRCGAYQIGGLLWLNGTSYILYIHYFACRYVVPHMGRVTNILLGIWYVSNTAVCKVCLARRYIDNDQISDFLWFSPLRHGCPSDSFSRSGQWLKRFGQDGQICCCWHWGGTWWRAPKGKANKATQRSEFSTLTICLSIKLSQSTQRKLQHSSEFTGLIKITSEYWQLYRSVVLCMQAWGRIN